MSRADSANLLDLGAANGLAIGDDGKSLECRRRQALRPRRELRPLDDFREFGARKNLPSPGDLDQLDAVSVVVVVALYLVERRGNVFRRRFVVGDHRSQIGCCNRVPAREERGLKQLRQGRHL